MSSTLTLRQSRLSLSEILRAATLPAADRPLVYRSGAVSGVGSITDAVTPATAAPGAGVSTPPAGELRPNGVGAIARAGPIVVPTPVHLPRSVVSPVQFTPTPLIPPGQITLKRPASSPASSPATSPGAGAVVTPGAPSHGVTLLAALGGALALFL
jgi:hypothetical protein